MLFYADEKLLKSHPTTLIVLVFHLLLTHFCRGQSQLIGSSQPIEATLGHDIILPCHLDPAEDASGLTLEWTRADLNPRFVHVWRDGQELESKKHPSFEGRTSLFINELKLGNISLKLSKVKAGDQGTYRCFIPSPGKQSSVQLVVGSDAVTLPVVTLAGIDKDTSGVVLQCESKGWYPEPEVVWLDSEGNLLSAGPTETVRGPDDLYTVSSRVTVEKRHSNNFTCRVQQKDIHQTRETLFCISDDFYKVHSSSAVPIIVGLAVCLALCIVSILLLVFFLLKIKKYHRDDNDREKNCSKKNKTADQSVTKEETERVTLMTVQMKNVNKKKRKKKSKHQNNTSTVPVVEVDPWGKYIRLRNSSNEEQQLEGWRLELNMRKSITYTFKNSFKLQAGNTFTLRAPHYGSCHDADSLVWSDLKLSPGDKLQVALISNTGEIHLRSSDHITILSLADNN
ncbi:butyrophilin subfamily 3 member A2-like [Dicentrarchus labrax]|uniref:Butyrophilin subfamily 1 member A1 n=1 Tax=Dicentrarchus labrax TaxID=13489 RepID=A0A8C4EFB3_DICLA|nr:butyrophilin subfamily 3 member A2-like [Dicentrarchus labrax]